MTQEAQAKDEDGADASHDALEKLAFHPRQAIGGEPSPFASDPDMHFIPMLSADCTFSTEIYLRVVMNMVKNPNVTSSHLFRADIFYDSATDAAYSQSTDVTPRISSMTEEYKPVPLIVPGFALKRSIVRQLIPRNPNLDRPLLQSCHFFEEHDPHDDAVRNLVVYIPHASSVESIPWYHPAVKALAVLHTWQPSSSHATPKGLVSIHFSFFPETDRTMRQERTAMKFLQILHKHGEGQRLGYSKRVHHDVIIPQARFQNTYSRLKIQYAKDLISGWVEQTPPEKHVFEDLGIAAFLIELWRDMYAPPSGANVLAPKEESAAEDKQLFPGFVDIGCGNGILVYILLLEGFKGWGFDARHRKTWDTLPDWVRENLKERILVPEPLELSSGGCTKMEDDRLEAVEHLSSSLDSAHAQPKQTLQSTNDSFVDGVFPGSPFIVSNHADELTAWTPLLAYLSNSPFISIPCCSHDLSGARFRASASAKGTSANQRMPLVVKDAGSAKPNAAETGTLTKLNPKAPSAFASLCMYVEKLTAEIGLIPEKEMLRIPSTRNTAIVGRRRENNDSLTGVDYRIKREKVLGILQRELRMGVADISKAWIDRAHQIARTKANGH